MSSIVHKDGNSEGDSGFVTPDSTTRDHKTCPFSEGEDVLSHGKDGLFYLGTIVVVDSENDRCLVQFQDSTAHWSLHKDLTKLKLPESDELCVVCKSSKSSDANEIVLCHICEQGYHQGCLQPKISDKYCELESQWECSKCSGSSMGRVEKKKELKTSSPKKQHTTRADTHQIQDSKLSPPYNMHNLTWDPGHKVNREQTYCYCGGPGEWYNRMLQCLRCRQWFHEACVDCLQIPMLFGDRFYVFVCALCNGGTEFVHRLPLKWVDVVHLALFNLTLHESKTYFEQPEQVSLWISENWELFQTPLELQRIPVSSRNSEVMRALEGNRPRFKCGSETKKKATLWGLRIRVPPLVPTVALSTRGPLTDECRKHIVYNSRRLRSDECPPIPMHYTMAEKVVERPASPLKTQNAPLVLAKGGVAPVLLPTPVVNGLESEADKKAGVRLLRLATKRGRPKMKLERQTLAQNQMLKKQRGRPRKYPLGTRPTADFPSDLRQRGAQKLLRKALKKAKIPSKLSRNSTPSCTSNDDASSRGTLESFIPPPSNFEGRNNPFLDSGLGALTAPVWLVPPVVKSFNRQLNANDIRIGKNGEVKRRRQTRRKFDRSQLLYLLQSATLQVNGTNARVTSTSYLKSCLDLALGQPNNANGDDMDQPALPAHEVGVVTLSDLQSTVKTYFGTANRVANGEKFNVLASRTNADGVMQYLIEWGN